jgi:BTB/POZ domain
MGIDQTIDLNGLQIRLEDIAEDNECRVKSHMAKMYRDEIFTDVQINCADGKSIRAHKTVLARSPVFMAMFSSDMLENNSATVSTNVFDSRTMEALIKFIYTDEVANLGEIDGNLMEAADFYDLPDLKEACRKSLERNINGSNFGATLQLAERFGIVSLREAVFSFITR